MVKQDRRKHLTRFEQEFVEGRGKSATRKKFSLAFRTLNVPQMVQRLEKAGLRSRRCSGTIRVVRGTFAPTSG